MIPTTNVLVIIVYHRDMFVMESGNVQEGWRRTEHTVTNPLVQISSIVETLLYVSIFQVCVINMALLNALMVMMNIFVTLGFQFAQVIAFVCYFP